MFKYICMLFALTGCQTMSLDRINTEVNRVAYVSDMENYGVENYRATPEEFYANGGDCEDYVYAKRELLRGAGVADDRIQYIIATEKRTGTQHFMLMVDDHIMDNQSPMLENKRYLHHRYKHIIYVRAEVGDLMWLDKKLNT